MTATVVAVAGAGGSLTTSIACNLAGLLARAGNRTLLVTAPPPDRLVHDLGLADVPIGSVVQGVRLDLDVLPLDPGGVAAEALGAVRAAYDVVIVDGSGGSAPADAAVRAADCLVVPVRPDRAATSRAQAEAQSRGVPVLGVVVAGVPVRPRAVLARTRRALQETLDGVPVFVAKVRAEVTVAWSARDRGLLVHELAAGMDRGALDAVAIDAVLGLARDYAELAEEIVVRLHDGPPRS